MKFFRIKYFYSLICVLFACSAFVCANESFQNNLLKADLSQTSQGTVVLNLYMSKPYSEPVAVNKKSETEYVILLPETSNSMTSKPALKQNVSIIKNIEVKTQQYSEKIKGYTKIAVSSTKPVVILTQMHTLNSSDYISDKDYRELLSQMVEKELTKQSKTKQAKVAKPQLASSPKIENILSKKQIKEQSKPKADKIQPVKTEVAQEAVKEKLQAPMEDKSKQEKESQLAAQTQPEQEQLPKEILKINTEPPKSIKSSITETSLTSIKNIIKNENFVLFGSILAGLLFLLLLIKKAAKKVTKQSVQDEGYNETFEQNPVDISNYTQEFTEDMSWKEKFQTYVDATQTNKNPSVEDILQEEPALSDEDFPIINEKPIIAPEPNYENISSETSSEKTFREFVYANQEPEKEDISLDALFGGDEENYDLEEEAFEEIFDEDVINIDESSFYSESTNKAEENELVKSEFNIDANKGFYLVDFEDKTALVGHIDDEIFILKRFENRINGMLQARINEKRGSSASYMTKVGNFRGLVEVTPEKMNLLIEL